MAKRWYSVSVLSNFEKKVAEAIKDAVKQHGLDEDIEEVLVPTEEVTELRRNNVPVTGPALAPGQGFDNNRKSDLPRRGLGHFG